MNHTWKIHLDVDLSHPPPETFVTPPPLPYSGTWDWEASQKNSMGHRDCAEEEELYISIYMLCPTLVTLGKPGRCPSPAMEKGNDGAA